MSCHDIGRGMNEIVRLVVTQYDEGRININEAKPILATCAKAVYWCDGNEYEAVDYISGCRCGKCLNMVPKGEFIYPLYDLEQKYKPRDLMQKYRVIGGCGVCAECFDAIVESEEMIQETGPDLRKSIEDLNSYDRETFLSTGEHNDNNNGCRWVRDADWFD